MTDELPAEFQGLSFAAYLDELTKRAKAYGESLNAELKAYAENQNQPLAGECNAIDPDNCAAHE